MNKSKKIKITAAQREKGSLQGKTGRECPFPRVFAPWLCSREKRPQGFVRERGDFSFFQPHRALRPAAFARCALTQERLVIVLWQALVCAIL